MRNRARVLFPMWQPKIKSSPLKLKACKFNHFVNFLKDEELLYPICPKIRGVVYERLEDDLHNTHASHS